MKNEFEFNFFKKEWIIGILLLAMIIISSCSKIAPVPLAYQGVVLEGFNQSEMGYVSFEVAGISNTCTENFRWSSEGNIATADCTDPTNPECPINTFPTIGIPSYGDYRIIYTVTTTDCNGTYAQCEGSKAAITTYSVVLTTGTGTGNCPSNWKTGGITGGTLVQPGTILYSSPDLVTTYKCCCDNTTAHRCASGQDCLAPPVNGWLYLSPYIGACGADENFSCPSGYIPDEADNCGLGCTQGDDGFCNASLGSGWTCSATSSNGQDNGICQYHCNEDSDCSGFSGTICNQGYCRY